MQQRLIKLLIVFSLAGILLSGCSSSGGGGKPHIDAGDLVFKKWSETPSPGAVIVGGTAQLKDGGIHDSNTVIAYDENGAIVKIQIETHDTNITWDTRTGDTIDASGSIIDIYSGTNPADKNNIALMGNPTDPANNWEYQSFGAWMTDRSMPGSTFGAFSMGAQTAGSAIPTTASATFTGSAGGIYIDSTATDYTVSSDVTVTANFLNRSLDFDTSGTQITNIDTGTTTAAANLDMTGTLTYLTAKNNFSGPVTTTSLNGTTTGHFYGPSAEEVGGVFNLTGAPGEIYSGAYGAKQ